MKFQDLRCVHNARVLIFIEVIFIEVLGDKDLEKEVIKMPGGDRTGPAGMGPMTGRSAGYCAGYSVPGYMNPIPGRGFGRGFGRGGGFGRGRGWGRGFYGYPPAYPPYATYPPYAPPQAPGDERAFLKDELAGLEEEMKAIKSRMSELEKEEKK